MRHPTRAIGVSVRAGAGATREAPHRPPGGADPVRRDETHIKPQVKGWLGAVREDMGMPFGSSRSWPPEVTDEVAAWIDTVKSSGEGTGWVPDRLGLYEALVELRQWLLDPRRYQGQHKKSWESMTGDFARAVTRCGPRLEREAAAPVKSIQEFLASPSLRTDVAARDRTAASVDTALARMGATAGLTAAFDDLVDAVTTHTNFARLVADRRDSLVGCFAAGGRSLENERQSLAGVLRDSARTVAAVTHQLDGGDFKIQSTREAAGLTTGDRLALSQRLLAHVATDRDQAIWVVYADAKVRWSHWYVDVGATRFFDGDTLVSVLRDPAGADQLTAEDLPPEILNSATPFRMRADDLPDPSAEPFVAARVDLTGRTFTDPIATAGEIADSLVGLAAFRQAGTTWRRIRGYIHVLDGQALGSSSWIDPRTDAWVDVDHTDAELAGLAQDLPQGMFADADRLHYLVGLTTDIQDRGRPELTTIISGIRVIDVLTAEEDRVDTAYDLLTDTFAIQWARRLINDTIFRATEGIARDGTLRHAGDFTDLEELGRRLWRNDDSRPSGIIIDRKAALTSMDDLYPRLPEYHVPSRQLRTVHARVQTVDSLSAWVGDLISEFGQKVAQARRIRNSLAHGGPVSPDTVAIVAPFVRQMAATVVNTALWGAIEGQTTDEAFARVRTTTTEWRNEMSFAPSVSEALWPGER